MASTSAIPVQPAERTQPRARPAARTAPRRRAHASTRIAAGVVWIVVVAALLFGVVAMNVAVLGLNVELDELARRRAALQAENAALASQLSSAEALTRIERLARRKLGLVPADPERILYIRLAPKRR